MAADSAGAAFRWELDLDPQMVERHPELKGLGGRRVVLGIRPESIEHERFAGVDPQRIADLEGAIDVDLPITPFTNTLPIRRLDLRAGRRLASVRLDGGESLLVDVGGGADVADELAAVHPALARQHGAGAGEGLRQRGPEPSPHRGHQHDRGHRGQQE